MYYGLVAATPLGAGVRMGTTSRTGSGFWQAIRDVQRVAQVAILGYRWTALVNHGGPATRRAFALALRPEHALLRVLLAA